MKKKINSLSIDEGLKKSLEKILLSDSSEEDNFKILAIGDENEGHCDGHCDYYKTLCKANGLCVLTKEETFILDIIDQISDQDKRRKALQKYMDNYNPDKIKIEEPKPEA